MIFGNAMKMSFLGSLALIIICAGTAGAQDAKPPRYQALDEYINDTGDGSDFDKPVMLDDTADYAACSTDECARDVFRKAVFVAECAYITRHYGPQGDAWRIVGHDDIAAYVFGVNTYYDDLGIEVIASGRKRVIRFNITSPVESLKRKLGLRWDDDVF